ncbi:hypothetical protein JVX90_00300 [Gordonia sp. PDNC005]|uniref:hypothetical protein n=1 Tax=Gordonia sp. PDNC005 TaxID=2811424 RepID=UPI001964D781|nr:hypothetical protein [Gordonia sp. PDNC005]QRY62753.1 hypothetical protein JVX90_00300 [Gordonia sp. PDNC005]
MDCSPYRVAAGLLAAVQAHLADTRAGAAQRIAVYPHAAPAIEFGCNMAWVGVGSIAPIPGAKGPCGTSGWTLDLTIGVARCWPVADGNSAPPTAAVDSAARDVFDDGEAMRRAVVDAFDDMEFTVKSWQPMNPQGGAHGSTMTVTVHVGWGAFVEPGSPMLPGDPRA